MSTLKRGTFVLTWTSSVASTNNFRFRPDTPGLPNFARIIWMVGSGVTASRWDLNFRFNDFLQESCKQHLVWLTTGFFSRVSITLKLHLGIDLSLISNMVNWAALLNTCVQSSIKSVVNVQQRIFQLTWHTMPVSSKTVKGKWFGR